jgi:hypothetical protein
MSYAIPAYYDEPAPVDAAPRELVFVPRSHYQWLGMVVPFILCTLSWMGNGVPLLTDMGFSIFTLVSAYFLTLEFIRFPRRFGIGGMVFTGFVTTTTTVQ